MAQTFPGNIFGLVDQKHTKTRKYLLALVIKEKPRANRFSLRKKRVNLPKSSTDKERVVHRGK